MTAQVGTGTLAKWKYQKCKPVILLRRHIETGTKFRFFEHIYVHQSGDR